MIIDKILDRYDGADYNPSDFYFEMLCYGGNGIDISRAMDFGTEYDIRKELCKYIDDGEYNPKIKDFICAAEWLIEDNGTNWESIYPII